MTTEQALTELRYYLDCARRRKSCRVSEDAIEKAVEALELVKRAGEKYKDVL